MSQDNEENGEKSHEPTAKKLEDARRKGEIPKSVDLTTAAAYTGLLLTLSVFGGSSLVEGGAVLAGLVDHADRLAPVWFQERAQAVSGAMLLALAAPAMVWFGIPAIAALASIVAQRAIVVAPDKLQPKLNRISPIATAKNKFGRAGLFEFAKSFVKLAVYSLVLGIYLLWRLPDILALVQTNPVMTVSALGRMTVEFLAIVVAIAGAIGCVDFFWQRQEHLRKNRMSHKELIDEMKQTEGDPHMKQQRRQRGYDIAMNKMLADVPKADVVVVNPQHYAVALQWSRAPGAAPLCTAKGVDEIAARIREIAAKEGVPIHRDPPTARALHASVEIGEEIRPDHYRAVAAAIRFAELMRKKARMQRR